jgi:hypothetical protein
MIKTQGTVLGMTVDLVLLLRNSCRPQVQEKPGFIRLSITLPVILENEV